jgi:phage N-6-adenine-methyltransferase
MSDLWETPKELFDEIDNIFKLDLDVCAERSTAKIKDAFIAGEKDGLIESWSGRRCWMNPPYSKKRLWLEKAHTESFDGALVVALIPYSPGARWFNDCVRHRATVWAYLGRIQFVGAQWPCKFDCCLAIYWPASDRWAR